MNQTLEQLIKLQDIDLRLLEIKSYMGSLPLTVQNQESELTILDSECKNRQVRITEIDKDNRQYNNEIESMNSQLTKYKDQLYLVKSNKEYESLNNEIDHMKDKILNSEGSMIKLLEEKEILDEENKLNLRKIESINESLSANKIKLEAAMSETKNEQEELEKNRNTLLKKIDPRRLEAYEKIRHNREGVGMVSIIENACSGCYSQLPPQMIIEIKKSIDIISCPNCSIMLYWDNVEE